MTVRALALVALTSLLLSADHCPASPVLRLVADIPLPGPAVRFDYQSVDTLANRLYISHMNAGELIVFNLVNRGVEGAVGDLPKVTGVLAVPVLGKIYVSVPGERCVAVIDARTLRVRARLGEIGFPDGIAYAPDEKKLYVSDEAGGGELVIDCALDRVLTRIPIGGEAGNTVYDPRAKRVLVAVQTRNEIVEIDPYTDRVTARHKLAGAAHPHGMAVDGVHRLLFVANERDASLLTVDLKSMKVLSRHRVGGDPDVLAFDPGLGRLYVGSESGVVSVLTERNGKLMHDGNIVMAHAHTIAVDPRTHRVYIPLSSVDGHPIMRIMRPESPNN
jgi:DNA-binding beta-propeller fold protein YncE